jgi:hypothetical protein
MSEDTPKTSYSNQHKARLVTIFTLSLFTLLLSVNMVSPIVAQDAKPTSTPRTPVWLAFSAAREAIEEEHEVNLEIVKNYQYAQQEWQGGIDTCDSSIVITKKRPVYFGWAFTITSMRGDTYSARVSFDLDAVTVCDDVQVAAAPVVEESSSESSESSESSSEALPAPVSGSANMSGFSLGGHVDGLTSSAVSAMQSAGMTWVKKQLPYSAGLGKGKEFINEAHNNGFKILLGVVGDKNGLASDFDGYVASYTQFLAELAAAGADAIEVWNEPNIDREWPEGQINGANYVQLLAPAYNAIKGANGNTMVISAAPAPTGYFGAAGCAAGGCNDDAFMQQMADAGAANYMDCVGLHYNEGIVPPSQTSGDPRGEYPTYYFGSMLNRGYAPFGGKPVCFSEMGYLTPEGFGALPSAFGWAGNVTVADQAAWLADAAARAAQSGQVRLIIIWNVNFTRFDSDPMGGYAIIRPDGSCPACSALGTVMGG